MLARLLANATRMHQKLLAALPGTVEILVFSVFISAAVSDDSAVVFLLFFVCICCYTAGYVLSGAPVSPIVHIRLARAVPGAMSASAVAASVEAPSSMNSTEDESAFWDGISDQVYAFH